MKTDKTSTHVNLPLGPLKTFITAYGPKIKVTVACDPAEGKTKQEFKDECDINVILKRYAETGSLEHINNRQALYADVSAHDYQEAMDIVADARTAFLDLPAHVRDRFDNDPKQLLAFVDDPANRLEAAELGLLSAEATEALADQDNASSTTPTPPAEQPKPS